jgi:hypothetical protein
MSELAVVDMATLECSQGTATSMLSVTTPLTLIVEGHAVATIQDKNPGTNIKPLGLCKITGDSCQPDPIAPWLPGSSFLGIAGSLPIVTPSCKLLCGKGGTIIPISPGQSSLFVASAPPLSEADLRDLVDIARELGFPLTWGLTTGGLEQLFELAYRSTKNLDDLMGQRITKKLIRFAKAFGWAPDLIEAARALARGDKKDLAKTVVAAGITAGCTAAIGAGTGGVGAVAAAGGCGVVGGATAGPVVDKAEDVGGDLVEAAREEFWKRWPKIRP